MSKKTLFIGAIASIIAINSVFADTTVTSKQYVDTTRQATIPAAGTNANTPGSTVVTYTGTAGQIGERGILEPNEDYVDMPNANYLVTNGQLEEFTQYVGEQIDNLSDDIYEQMEQVTNLPETTVTYKTCYQEVNGDCILWNLSDRDVYGKCRTQDDCPPCDNGLARNCSFDGRCECNDFE